MPAKAKAKAPERDLFDEAGALRDEKTTRFLRKFIQAYADWVEKILRGPGELA